MGTFHDVMDGFFLRIGNTGSISNSDLVRIMTMSLIDDYKDDIMNCNPSYRGILDDVVNSIQNNSCLFVGNHISINGLSGIQDNDMYISEDQHDYKESCLDDDDVLTNDEIEFIFDDIF